MTRAWALILLSLSGLACNRDRYIRPIRKDIVETVYASGRIVSDREYNVYALVSGTIVDRLVKEGDTVRKGQALYIIKNDGAAANLQAAETGYDNAKRNLSPGSRILTDLRLARENAEVRFWHDSLYYLRLKHLMEQKIGTQNNLDAAYANFVVSGNQRRSAGEKYYNTVDELRLALESATSQLINARMALDHYTIRSQDGGTVFQTYKEKGETVRSNEMLVLLGETSRRIIRLAVDQQDIDKIRTGQMVVVRTDITGDSVFPATINQLYPVMDESDQTFRVDAVFADRVGQPFIHGSVEANIIIRKKSGAFVIPREAMIAEDSVLLFLDGRQRAVAVKTGIRTLEDVEILEGLDSLSRVVIPSKK